MNPQAKINHTYFTIYYVLEHNIQFYKHYNFLEKKKLVNFAQLFLSFVFKMLT